jgi:hypothetical protein
MVVHNRTNGAREEGGGLRQQCDEEGRGSGGRDVWHGRLGIPIPVLPWQGRMLCSHVSTPENQ